MNVAMEYLELSCWTTDGVGVVMVQNRENKSHLTTISLRTHCLLLNTKEHRFSKVSEQFLNVVSTGR
jgi:hypothetical protein